MRVLIAILCLCAMLFAESSVDSAKNRTQKSAKSSLDSAKEARQKRANKHILTIKKSAESTQDSAKIATQKKSDSAKVSTQKTQNLKPKKSAESKTPKNAESKQKATKKLGYRNVKITGISKQRSDKISFFVGAQLGIDIVSMQEITMLDRDANVRKWTSGGVSFGGKGGIISEEEWLGGRFYAEFSYSKIPKFNALNMGVDLDLLIKYYETQGWKIGGFLGLGGGMNVAFIAERALKKEGEKSLIAVGWVNIGLARFVYYHRTGIHSAELNVKIAYVTPTIYSLKNVESGVTTSYKSGASGVVMSYIYQF